jgi:hypothetical protein
MAQEIIPPGKNPVLNRGGPAEVQLVDDSINALREKINIFARLGAYWKSGRNAATVLVAMQKDVADAQREVVQHHANLIARGRKMELTDRFQAGISELTRRVDERTTTETQHYWQQLARRLDYYEDFFETRIREIREKVAAGTMSEQRAAVRIGQYETDRDRQQDQDRTLLNELMEANVRIVRKALMDYQPT